MPDLSSSAMPATSHHSESRKGSEPSVPAQSPQEIRSLIEAQTLTQFSEFATDYDKKLAATDQKIDTILALLQNANPFGAGSVHSVPPDKPPATPTSTHSDLSDVEDTTVPLERALTRSPRPSVPAFDPSTAPPNSKMPPTPASTDLVTESENLMRMAEIADSYIKKKPKDLRASSEAELGTYCHRLKKWAQNDPMIARCFPPPIGNGQFLGSIMSQQLAANLWSAMPQAIKELKPKDSTLDLYDSYIFWRDLAPVRSSIEHRHAPMVIDPPRSPTEDWPTFAVRVRTFLIQRLGIRSDSDVTNDAFIANDHIVHAMLEHYEDTLITYGHEYEKFARERGPQLSPEDVFGFYSKHPVLRQPKSKTSKLSSKSSNRRRGKKPTPGTSEAVPDAADKKSDKSDKPNATSTTEPSPKTQKPKGSGGHPK